MRLFWVNMHLAARRKSIESPMGGPSHEVIAFANSFAHSRVDEVQVLDLGCGNGRNSFLLAGVGCAVTAVDVSAHAIAQLRDLARDYGLPIHTVVSDVQNFQFIGQYDLILAHGILHFLERSAVTSLIRRIRDATRPGGYNIFTVAPFEDIDHVITDLKAAGHKNSLAEREVLTHYLDWGIVSREYYHKWDWHPNVGIHDHPIEKTICRKPNGNSRRIISATEIPLANPGSRERIQELGDIANLIHQSRQRILKIAGKPDLVLPYRADGPQFSFKGFVQSGYLLELLVYGNRMIYVSNGRVSGVSAYFTNAFRFESVGAQTTEAVTL